MSRETISESAKQFYRDHRTIASELWVADASLAASRKYIGDLRSGHALTSQGLGGAAASRQADITAENLDTYDIPRRNEIQDRYNENLDDATKHLNQYFGEYVEIALEEMSTGSSDTKLSI